MNRPKPHEIIYPEALQNKVIPLLEQHLPQLEDTFKISISLRGNKIMFSGHTAGKKEFNKFISQLMDAAESNGDLNTNFISIGLDLLKDNKLKQVKQELQTNEKIDINAKSVFPKTMNQKAYIQAIRRNDLVFGIGPAGTGKTFLAISMALHFLLQRRVERIVLTRPVVEAGEKLGFLPGDIQQKVNPYFRPLYDALYFLIGFERTAELIEKEIIEIAPLAYMRGRTIANAFIILDEGQNTLDSQMKMFLTRFGQYSKVVVTADPSQLDLPEPKKSGIFKAITILKDLENIQIIHFEKKDIVRHNLVQKIIEAYEANE
jgi:phosphate starvation-inducible PhoH-like protein